MIKTYKKTATIDAVEWDGRQESTQFILDWASSLGVDIRCEWDFSYIDGIGKLEIPTLEGPMFASVGDFIAKGVNNEFWPIKPDIMGKTYQEV